MRFFTVRAGMRRPVFGKATVDTSQIKAGATFARTGARDVVETAQIIRVQEHAGGVAHVHYACRLQHASTVLEDGPRTLALQAFVERFRTPLSRPPASLKDPWYEARTGYPKPRRLQAEDTG